MLSMIARKASGGEILAANMPLLIVVSQASVNGRPTLVPCMPSSPRFRCT